jgi:integrase
MYQVKSTRKDSSKTQQILLNLDLYDKNPSLTTAELQEINRLQIHPDSANSIIYRRNDKILSRLLTPIKDVLEIVGSDTRCRHDLVKLMLREMSARNKSFWGWTESDWCEIICASCVEFKKRHKFQNGRQFLICIAFFLGNFTRFYAIGQINFTKLALRIYGSSTVKNLVNLVVNEVTKWGYAEMTANKYVSNTISQLILSNHSPNLEDITTEFLSDFRLYVQAEYVKGYILTVSKALACLGIINKPLTPLIKERKLFGNENAREGIPDEWVFWCRRWYDTSTLTSYTRKGYFDLLLRVGRWLADKHPNVTSPIQWNRDLAIEFVKAVDNMKIGDWSVNDRKINSTKQGKALSPKSKDRLLASMRKFFRDCQEWQWIPRNFSPERALATPSTIRNLIGPNPRVIDSDIWAKLLWAGLNITSYDLPQKMFIPDDKNSSFNWYPLEMIKAIILVWLFAGLRRNEICRLRLGCVRWIQNDITIPGTDEIIPKDAVCYLDVPVNKTGTAYTKPVDRIVGEAIESWLKIRPKQPATIDPKDGSVVDYLFFYRGQKLGYEFINKSIIPMLCKKAGVPTKDARGNITSHRARSTIATQLANAKDPMTIFELKEWLGHRDISSTINYTKISPTKLAKSYQDAEYFKRNIRMIEVLIDKDVIKSGGGTSGETYLYYDLGHGYCKNDFFVTCKHRMACSRCDFYEPKTSTLAQMLEAKKGIERMFQEIPLTLEEKEALEGDVVALDKWIQKLADIPTPTGKTPRELGNL